MSERAQQWTRVVGAWRRSGRSQAAYCREHDLNYATFGAWKRRLDQEQRGAARSRRQAAPVPPARPSQDDPPAGSANFIEVSLGRPASTSYEVVLPGGTTLRLPRGFDGDEVSRLIALVIEVTSVE